MHQATARSNDPIPPPNRVRLVRTTYATPTPKAADSSTTSSAKIGNTSFGGVSVPCGRTETLMANAAMPASTAMRSELNVMRSFSLQGPVSSRRERTFLNDRANFSCGLSFLDVALGTHVTGRPAYDPYQRRVDLYTRAAPVFRSFGYRQVTMKALAYACGMSPGALYRYFPSKLDFALFPLEDPPSGYCAAMLNEAVDAQTDPLRGLRAALETGVAHADLMALGVRLAIEAGRADADAFSHRQIDLLDATIADVLLRCVPALGPHARDLAHTLVSLVVTSGAARAQVSQEDLWRQGGPIIRGYLFEAGVDEGHFCEVFSEAYPRGTTM